MYLLDCGTRHPIVAFTDDGSVESTKVVDRLIAFGHANMGEKPEHVQVEIEGVYRNKAGRDRFDHVIELRSFKEIGSPQRS